MPLYFLVTKVLLQPLVVLLLVTGAGVAALWRKRKEGRRRLIVVSAAFAALVLSTVPAALYVPLRALERPFPPLAGRPKDAEAIVVLAGGIRPADAVRRTPELMEDTLYRCLHAAELYHQGGPCPVVVTGGTLDPKSAQPPVAPSMRDFLVRLGVAPEDVIVEGRARTTFENAVETKKLLDERRLRRVVLVTEALHMYRSLRCFRKVGVEAVPAACRHRATALGRGLDFFLPDPGAALDARALAHEWFGIAWYWSHGWL